MAKVLVTCVGSGVGQSVIDSLTISGKHYIIGCDANRNVYAFQKCNDFKNAPSIYADDYVNFLLDVCISNDVDILIPGHDHELLLLAKKNAEFQSHKIAIIISHPDIIDISRDKYEWYKIFNEKGVSIVPTFRVKQFKKNPDHSILPAIIKPAGGSASQGITIINDLNGLEKLNEEDIIQPYLFPRKEDPNYNTIKRFVSQGKFVQMSEISIQLIFKIDSEFAGIFISKNSLKNGVPVFVDPIQPEEFVYLDEIMKFVPILKNNKVVGPVNIQGRITEKGLHFFEMNMRFTGITGNRAQLGFNEVEFLVNNFLGRSAKLGGYANNKLGVRQVACTTIPRSSNKNIKKNITIVKSNSEAQIEIEFISFISNNKNYYKKNIINSIDNAVSLNHNLDLNEFNIYNCKDEIVQSVYCQTDALINFISFDSTDAILDTVHYYQEQLRTVIQANIPLIINVFLSDDKSGYNKTISNSFSYITLLSPAINYKEFNGSLINIHQIIEFISA